MRFAARQDDMHVCPKDKHVGGHIYTGCTGVTIESKPAARAGDSAICEEGMQVDTIVSGAATVLIHGVPMARLLEPTAHGGFVMTSAATVTIGGPSADPKNLKRILDNALEIQRLKARLLRRLPAFEMYAKYARGEPTLSPSEKVWLDLAKKLLTSKSPSPGLQKGADYHGELDAIEQARAEAVRDAIREAMQRDMDRIEQLQKENGQLQNGQTPEPSVPDPNLETPVRNPIRHLPGPYGEF